MDTVLFDGDCNFCRASAERLERWTDRTKVRIVSFRDPGVLEQFPMVTAEQADRALQLVTAEGRVYEGAAAISVLLTRRTLGASRIYFVPGIKQLSDRVYAAIARRRFEIMGRAGCSNGACELKFRAKESKPVT